MMSFTGLGQLITMVKTESELEYREENWISILLYIINDSRKYLQFILQVDFSELEVAIGLTSISLYR